MKYTLRNALISLGVVGLAGSVILLSQDCLPGRTMLTQGDEKVCFTEQEYNDFADFLIEKYEKNGKLRHLEYELYVQILNIEFQKYKEAGGELSLQNVDLSGEGREELTKRVQREVYK